MKKRILGKGFILTSMIIITIMSISMLAASTDYATDAIGVSMINQDPDPVEPGKYVDLRFKIENLGTEQINSVAVEFLPNYPFTIDESPLQEIGTLAALQKDNRAVIIKFKARVDENAVQGTNKAKIRVKTATSGWSTYDFNVDVRTIDANIAVQSVLTNPTIPQPGNDVVVQIKVKNMADSTLKDISLKIDLLLTSFSATGAVPTTATASVSDFFDALPFAPVESGTEKRIRQLAPSEEYTFSYKMHVYPTAESRAYKVPIKMTYYDSLGTEYTKNDIIGIIVNSEPDIRVVLDDSTLTESESAGKISIKFVNKGVTNIKFLNVNLKKHDKIDVTSGEEVYVGKIDSDDYETIDFDIFVKKTTETVLWIPVHYEYMDANNNKYSKDTELQLKFPVVNTNNKYSPGSYSTTTIIIVAVIVLIAALLIFRAVRKKSKK